MTPTRGDLDLALHRALTTNDTVFERVRPGAYLATLPGQHRLTTAVWLVIGDHSLLVEAFFVRKPDENHGEFYGYLLRRNARMYGVAFALDSLGDVYLVGRVSLAAISPEEIDRILGCVLTYSDESFDPVIAIGFRSSIKRERAWREKRGLSAANLAAFARFAD